MFDVLSDETMVKYATRRICGKGRPVPVRSGGAGPCFAQRGRPPLQRRDSRGAWSATRPGLATWTCFLLFRITFLCRRAISRSWLTTYNFDHLPLYAPFLIPLNFHFFIPLCFRDEKSLHMLVRWLESNPIFLVKKSFERGATFAILHIPTYNNISIHVATILLDDNHIAIADVIRNHRITLNDQSIETFVFELRP